MLRPGLRPLLDQLPAVDTSLADMLPGHGKLDLSIPLYFVLHWWTVTPWDWDAGAPEEGAALTKLELHQRKPNIGSYHGVEFGGVPYQVAPLDEVAWHAGGSPGLRQTNSRTVGFAVATPSPSFRPRRIEGEVKRPWFDRADKTMGAAWYPPVPDLKACLAAVAFARFWLRETGVPRFSAVYTHHQINPEKNDLRNMDMPHNTGLSFAEFLALVQA